MELVNETAFSIITTRDFIYYIDSDKSNHHNRFYKTDLTNVMEVDLDEYAYVKFGNAWRTIHSIYTECAHLKNGEVLSCHFESSVIHRHDIEGKKIHQYSIPALQTGFDSIYGIAADNRNGLWLVQPSSHSISQYDLKTERELFKLGGDYDNPVILNYPEHIRVYGDFIYISDMGNHRICQLHIEIKEVNEYLKFEEPVWEYHQFKNRDLVRLQSGIYII